MGVVAGRTDWFALLLVTRSAMGLRVSSAAQILAWMDHPASRRLHLDFFICISATFFDIMLVRVRSVPSLKTFGELSDE